MTWRHLLFAHWKIDSALLRPLIPGRLTIETFDGAAWIGVIPFTMEGVRAAWAPPIPGIADFHELNVRTYVTDGEMSGVWFFSLDAASRVAVRAARATYALPYYDARMSLERDYREIRYSSHRIHRGAPDAALEAKWEVGERLPLAEPGSIAHFLTERYCLYSARGERIHRAEIHHDPWPLHESALTQWDSSMVAALGLPEPQGDPLLHGAPRLDVRAWRPRRLT